MSKKTNTDWRSRGYIKLWRVSDDHPLYRAEPFTKWQAWVDLLLLANHKAREVSIRGNLIPVKRGQVLAGEDYLARRWRWSRGKVRRFLSYLSSKTVQQIVQQKSYVCSLLSITNWEVYQPDDTADGTTDGQQTVQQTDTPKNVENVENVKNPPNPPRGNRGGDEFKAGFDEAWKAYPDKAGRQKAIEAYVKHRRAGDTQADILAGIERYKKYVAAKRATGHDLHWRNGQTFFFQANWRDEWAATELPPINTAAPKPRNHI